MTDRVMVAQKKRRVQRPPPRARGVTTVGVAGQVTVQFDTGLGGNGRALAAAVLAVAQADYDRVSALFGVPTTPSVLVSIEQLSPASDGTGGAWHTTCQDTTLHVDASFGAWQRTAALWIAEYVEVLEALQSKGWDCGNTNGEGLSRVIAEWAYPGALDDYSCAAVWLDGSRPNYVDSQQGTDTDDESNGLGPLFLWWIMSQGHDLGQVVQGASTNLAGTYAYVLGQSDGWTAFQSACAEAWPPGQPSGVGTDNPWPQGQPPTPPSPPTPPTPPTPPSPPTSSAPTLTLTADLVAGDYALVPVGQLRRRLTKAKLSAGELAQLVQEVLALVFTLLGGGAPAPTPPPPGLSPAKGERP